jgi:hypothetical protein
MPQLRRLVVSFSPRCCGFNPRYVHVGFVVDKVTLGQVFSEYFCFSCQFSFPKFSISLICHPGLVQWAHLPPNYHGTQSHPTLRIRKGWKENKENVSEKGGKIIRKRQETNGLKHSRVYWRNLKCGYNVSDGVSTSSVLEHQLCLKDLRASVILS